MNPQHHVQQQQQPVVVAPPQQQQQPVVVVAAPPRSYIYFVRPALPSPIIMQRPVPEGPPLPASVGLFFRDVALMTLVLIPITLPALALPSWVKSINTGAGKTADESTDRDVFVNRLSVLACASLTVIQVSNVFCFATNGCAARTNRPFLLRICYGIFSAIWFSGLLFFVFSVNVPFIS